jgi:hypothetical protein
MVHKQVHDTPTPLRTVRAELPSACENIIGRALAKSPADRFQTAEEFKSALATLSVTGSRVSRAAPASGAATALAPPSARSRVLPEEPTVVLKMPVRRQLSIAVLMVAVVFAGVPTVYLVWGSRAAQPQPLTAAARSGVSAHASPSVASDVASTSETAPPSARTAESPPRPPLPSVGFSQIRLLQLKDDRPRDRDVLLTFDLDALDVIDGTTVIERARYRDVIGLFHSHSREPRWAKPDGTPVTLAKIGGRFAFLKGPSDWITVRTPAAFIPLHVPESELARLVSELETRTGTHVIRTR